MPKKSLQYSRKSKVRLVAVIEEISTKKTGAGDTFYKVIADGKTYNAFNETPAFNLLSTSVFMAGSVVELKFEMSKDGKHKHLIDILAGSGPAPQASKSNPTNPTGATPAAPVDWDGKDRRIARQACIKASARLVAAAVVPDAGPDMKTFADDVLTIAGEFEKWVYRETKKEGA